MSPEISEFSYGFAITNELVGWIELAAAPVFPSLIEEGKAGGGYDVKLDRPGAPLYLQFKRAECMTTRNAREFNEIRNRSDAIDVPFYRFAITERKKSDQHEMLLELDREPNHVFYVAPRFHRITEINEAWRLGAVAGRSIFISPRSIGSLDFSRHTVAFDASQSWVCSTPKRIEALSSREVLAKLRAILETEEQPLRVRLPAIVEELRDAERRGRERVIEKRRRAQEEADQQAASRAPEGISRRTYQAVEEPATPTPVESAPPQVRDPKPIKAEMSALREAADLAAHVFDTQLVIVQRAD